MNKAEQVCAAYDEPFYEGYTDSEICYSCAIAAAHDLGGVEIYNSNDGNSSISFAPTRVFGFDDETAVTVTYGACFEGQ